MTAGPAVSRRLTLLAVFASLFGPATTIPQIVLIYSSGDVSGVSVPTWLGMVAVNVIWTAYGAARHDKAIVFSNVLWGLVEALVVLGVVVR